MPFSSTSSWLCSCKCSWPQWQCSSWHLILLLCVSWQLSFPQSQWSYSSSLQHVFIFLLLTGDFFFTTSTCTSGSRSFTIFFILFITSSFDESSFNVTSRTVVEKLITASSTSSNPLVFASILFAQLAQPKPLVFQLVILHVLE